MEKVILTDSGAALIACSAAQAHPMEACGLLYGERSGDCFKVLCVEPLENAERADPKRRFSIAPNILLDRHKAARREGRVIIGHYHSHPEGLAEPSQTDKQHISDPHALWLIYGRGEWGRPCLNAFTPTPCGKDFKSLEVISSAD